MQVFSRQQEKQEVQRSGKRQPECGRHVRSEELGWGQVAEGLRCKNQTLCFRPC